MSENHELRVAVLGVGLMGSDHVKRLTNKISGARVSVINDFDTERANSIAAGVPGARVVADPFEAINADDVDVVVLATPSPTHEAQLMECLRTRKPVLCEKPLTPDAESSLRIVKAEAELGVKLIQIGFMRRFDNEYRQMKQLIETGELGNPLMVHCVHRNPAGPPGFTSAMAVTESLVHEVDSIRFLLDEEITSVQVLQPRSTTLAGGELRDPQLALYETASGRLVDAEIFITTGVAYEVRTEVVGELGSATIGLDVGLIRKSKPGTWGGTITPGFQERFGQAYDTEVQSWVNAARSGAETGNYVDGPDAWDGYAAQAVCAAGVESVKTGLRVPVSMVDKASVLASRV